MTFSGPTGQCLEEDGQLEGWALGLRFGDFSYRFCYFIIISCELDAIGIVLYYSNYSNAILVFGV